MLIFDLGDMWQYFVVNNTWRLANNSANVVYPTHAGIQPGVPGARQGAAAWTNGSDLFLFGGRYHSRGTKRIKSNNEVRNGGRE